MAGKNGGARPGAGRKPTGVKTKCYTVTLPIEEAELLEKHAAQNNTTVNKYIRDLIRQGGQYTLESFDDKYVTTKNGDEENVDDSCGYELMAAEEVKPYDTGKSD